MNVSHLNSVVLLLIVSSLLTSCEPTSISDRSEPLTISVNSSTDSEDNRSESQAGMPIGEIVGIATVGKYSQLDGSSSESLASRLEYRWTLVEQPSNSNANLDDNTGVRPQLYLDQPGRYVTTLEVGKQGNWSEPQAIVIDTVNSQPIANAGKAIYQPELGLIRLDANRSIDVDGDALSYRWSLVKQPLGSTATLSNPFALRPTFTMDIPGEYEAALVVFDGKQESITDTVTIGSDSIGPSADAGEDRLIAVGELIELDGVATSHKESKPITYEWALLHKPQGSTIELGVSREARSVFMADVAGDYVAQLTATDGLGRQDRDTVLLSTQHIAPVAEIKANQKLILGQSVMLSGAESKSIGGAALTYQWSLLSKPEESTVSIDSTSALSRSATLVMTPDVPGDYVVQLAVDDGIQLSKPKTLLLSTDNLRPIADAGDHQQIDVGQTVQLDGSTSTDADGDPLSYRWSLLAKPENSGSRPTAVQQPISELTVDQPGLYVAQLIVNDGIESSDPATSATEARIVVLPAPSLAGTTISLGPDLDDDGDGVPNPMDNCLLVANPDQRDTDQDGFGNACDADLNNDGIVNFLDLAQFEDSFLTNNADADFNGDGSVNFLDFTVVQGQLFGPPGPTGLDLDGDGVLAEEDNCLAVNNPGQRDTDGDFIGNYCDADFNNDGAVNFLDFFILQDEFLSNDPDTDINGDGVVNFIDLSLFQSLFLLTPGPSGLLPPRIVPIGEQVIKPNQILSFTLNAVNANQTPLTFSADNVPDNAQFDPATQTFSFTPTIDQLGTNVVIFTVTDGTLTGTWPVTIRVKQSGVSNTLPRNGERNVSLVRPILIEFDQPIMAQTLTTDSITVMANGILLTGTVTPSQTGRAATFQADSAFPAASTVRVTVVGGLIQDQDGDFIDGDRDGMDGGNAVIDFTTHGLSPIANTNVFGFIFDSMSQSLGNPQPIQGVRVEVLGMENIFAITDATGRFELMDVPAPEFFVKVDPSNAVLPAGRHYPTLTKPMHSVAGRTVQIAENGVPFNIHLPSISDNDAVPIIPDQDTVVPLGSDAIADLTLLYPNVNPAAWELFSLTVPANSAIDDDGNPLTQIAAFAVTPDALPAPLPPGLDPMVVYSVDAGADSIDGFATFSYPNVEGFAPGTTSLTWAFDHDAGEWIVTGTATVTQDGSKLVTDLSSTDRILGWHIISGPLFTISGGGTGPSGEDDGDCTALDFVSCAIGLVRTYSSCKLAIGACIVAGVPTGGAACFLSATPCVSSFLNTYASCSPCLFQGTPSQVGLPDYLSPEMLEFYQLSLNVQPVWTRLAEINREITVSGQTTADQQQEMLELYSQLDSQASGDYSGYLQSLLSQISAQSLEIPDANQFYENLDREVLFAVLDGDQIVFRGTTRVDGSYEFFYPTTEDLTILFYEPVTGTFATQVTSESMPLGQSQIVRDYLLSMQPDPFDLDQDGLADLVELVLGTSFTLADSDGDGISDGDEVAQGLNPLDGAPVITGIVSNAALIGEAKAVIVNGSALDSSTRQGYVATGSNGVATLDLNNFAAPIIQGQLNLAGVNVDIAVDSSQFLAALAAGSAGLHIVDVSDPVMPQLRATLTGIGAINSVEILDGVVYAAGESLRSIDSVSFEVIDSITLSSAIESLAREGDYLYAVTNDNRLTVIDISGPTLVVRGSISVPALASKVFVGNQIAYISDGRVSVQGNRGGYSTIDVSDADNLLVISGLDVPSVQSGNLKTVTNGSGIAVVAAGTRGVQLHDASDPNVTYSLITEIDTPGSAEDVFVAGGLAYLADGPAGLQIVNYSSFDVLGQAPTVTINVSAQDVDLVTPGVQVIEGSNVPVFAEIADDVQVRNAELVLDGQVFRSDVSFPFDFSVAVPALTGGASEIELQVRATDTGGNSTISSPVVLNIVPDTVQPQVLSITPGDSTVQPTTRRVVRIAFSESMDTSSLNAQSVNLVPVGVPLSEPIQPISFQFSNQDKVVRIDYGALDIGDYQILVQPNLVTDRAGNLLDSEPLIAEFSVAEATATWVGTQGGFWNIPANWSDGELPSSDDMVFINLPSSEIVTVSGPSIEIAGLVSTASLVVASGELSVSDDVSANEVTLANNGQLTVGGTVFAARVFMSGGILRNATVLPLGADSAIQVSGNNSALENVTLQTNLFVSSAARLLVRQGLSLDNADIVLENNGDITELAFDGEQILTGIGRILFRTGTEDVNSTKVSVNEQLTIEQGITVLTETGGGELGSELSGSLGGSILFKGDIVANVTDAQIIFGTFHTGNFGFINEGSIIATNGADILSVGLVNNGSISATDGTLALFGFWSAGTGTFNLDDTDLSLGGVFTLSDISGMSTTGAATFGLAFLDLEDGVFNPNDLWGSLSVSFSIISNGTLQSDVPLTISGNSGLDNVTLATDLTVDLGSTLGILNDLTLANSQLTINSTMNFEGNGSVQNVLGTGEIILSNPAGAASTATIQYGGEGENALQIGSGITARTGLSGGTFSPTAAGSTLINLGLILANSQGVTVNINGDSIINEGTITADDNTNISTQNVFNQGQINIGAGALIEVIGGGISFSSTSELHIDIAGTAVSDFGRLFVEAGGTTLDGTLTVSLDGAFTPVACDEFRVYMFNGREGEFQNFIGPDLGTGDSFELVYTSTELSLVTPICLGQ